MPLGNLEDDAVDVVAVTATVAVRPACQRSREIEGVGIAGVAGAEDHAVQIRIANQVPVAVLQRSQQLAGIGIECVDEPIAKVANENVVAERRRRRIR